MPSLARPFFYVLTVALLVPTGPAAAQNYSQKHPEFAVRMVEAGGHSFSSSN